MDTLARLRTALAGRYDVEHELGRGGMAVVYLARDLRHERRVAVKVFEHGGGLPDAAERFLREIRVAAQLQHPNILPVFDSGDADGLLYYVMPYVEGASLRERLEREGALPVPDAVQIARDVALALDFAHQAGVVHRDVKPDNIMLAGGVAVVADFGIARALESSRLTETGMAIGTPAYMSPEQATASPNVDGRSDIYALGCVLYEMLAGAPPFSGPTGQAIMARHTADHVPPISTIRKIDSALEATVVRALAKTPADRWPTGRTLAEALASSAAVTTAPAAPVPTRRWSRWLAVAASVVVLATAAVATLTRARAATPARLRRVALLPFTVRGDSSHAALGDGLIEGIMSGLIRVEGLSVLPAARVQRYRAGSIDALGVGEELDADAVLIGSVEFDGGTLRVVPQLLEVRSGRLLFTRKFDAQLGADAFSTIFEVQDSIASQIVLAVLPTFTADARAALERGGRTRDQVAYELYAKGRRATYELTLAGAERGIALFEQAIARDSAFADAYVGLADAYTFLAQWGGFAPVEIMSRMRYALERAIMLDSANGPAFAQKAVLRFMFEWDWDGAWGDFRRAVRLSPGSGDAAVFYAQFLNEVGQHDSALYYMRRAVAIDPANSFYVMNLAARFGILGQPDSLIFYCERAVAMDSAQWVASVLLASAYAQRNRVAEAREQVDRVHRIAGDSVAAALLWSLHSYADMGDQARVRATYQKLEALSQRKYVQRAYIASARLKLGDRAGALDAFEESYRNHDPELAGYLDLSLCGEPRFAAIVRQVFRTSPVRAQRSCP